MTRSPMRPFLVGACLALATILTAGAVAAKPEVGQPAPAFSVADTTGKTWSLADLAGKGLILELSLIHI